MNILDIKGYDVVNGPGIRMSIWTAGCNNHCSECWAKHTWNPNQGKPTSECLSDIEEILLNNEIDGVSILGGDPLYSTFNRNDSEDLIKILNIWLWSGYSFDDIYHKDKRIFDKIDVIVEGKYDKDKRNLNLFYRGSSNQRIIFMRKPTEKCDFKYYVSLFDNTRYTIEDYNKDFDK